MEPLRVIRGDLWDHHPGSKLVVTTNIGWDRKHGYANNMGAGVALQAAMRYAGLSKWYGRFCYETAPDTPVVERIDLGLILFPVKPLLPAEPSMSWNQLANLDLIERSTQQLAQIEGHIVLGFPGCGNGKLSKDCVLPILKKYLCGSRFTVVDNSI